MFDFSIQETVLVIVDAQGKLLDVMYDSEAVQKTLHRLIFSCHSLGIPTLFTEQYPKGLGPTLESLKALVPDTTPTIEKTAFSCCAVPEFKMELTQRGCKHLILAGVEAHVCVLQTAADAIKQGLRVTVVADAINSRSPENLHYALLALRDTGATLLPMESLIFGILKDSKHPFFKTFSELIK